VGLASRAEDFCRSEERRSHPPDGSTCGIRSGVVMATGDSGTHPVPSAILTDDPKGVLCALQKFHSYRKLCGWLLFRYLGFPSLRGIIITRWDAAAEVAVRDFSSGMPSNEVLLRSDSGVRRGDLPAGGDLVNIDELPARLGEYLSLGRVVFLLEPRSRFDDLYSLSIQLLASGTCHVEAVGAGFDASDLNRGDSLSHEGWTCKVDSHGRLSVTDHWVIDSDGYHQSRRARITKVGDLLRRNSDTDAPRSFATEEEVLNRLVATRHTLLPSHSLRYQPLPPSTLEEIIGECAVLPAALEAAGQLGRPIVVSLSFIQTLTDKVYWDVASPAVNNMAADAVGG